MAKRGLGLRRRGAAVLLIAAAASLGIGGCLSRDDATSAELSTGGSTAGSNDAAGEHAGAAGSGGTLFAPGTAGSATSTVTDPGSAVTTSPSAALSAEAEGLRAQLSELSTLDADGIAARYPARFEEPRAYDVAQVVGLDRIQASSLELGSTALARLAKRGFVITEEHPFPSFAYGYASIYLEDLPVYVSADSILNAVHRSYEGILAALEQGALSRDLDALLAGMHRRLAERPAGADATALADADLYLGVARSLLQGARVRLVAGGSSTELEHLVSLAEAATQPADIELFGVRRDGEDFSQFSPRAHYADTEELSRYFRAMMWLGRVDLRMLEVQSDGTEVFHRRQLQSALLLRDLLGDEERERYARIDRTLAAFVGEPDYMVLSDLDRFLGDLGITGRAELANFTDAELAQALVAGGYGIQRISSHIMLNGVGSELPRPRSFALLGQRYVLDSHVFSNVVFDRVNGDPTHPRLMPSPLDAAFAAFGNDQAGALLDPELRAYAKTGYPSALAQMRLLSDEHPDRYWQSSLYTLWLDAIRQLSPRATSAASDAQSLFPVAKTEAWGRRLLATQLGSWSELRHDTILYAKQSYTGGATCDFPDAYVDPYPRFFEALTAYAVRGAELIASLGLDDAPDGLGARVREYFMLVAEVSGQLRAIAEYERSGSELTPQMLDFINDAVVVGEAGCEYSPEVRSGWYKKLFFAPEQAAEQAPAVADVHTQPMDATGTVVGRVLHVGTVMPQLMVVIAEGCSGPRAYAGLASTYREKITENFKRLDDEAWLYANTGQPQVPWMRDLVVSP